MENFEELTNWALAQRKINLRFENLTYIKDWLPGYFDVRAICADSGVEIVGRSVAETDERAVGKSLIEMFERITLHRSKSKSLSGIAAHFDEDQAIINAALEAIERDAVLAHFNDGIPYKLQNLQPTDKAFGFFLDKCRERNVSVSIYRAESLFQQCEVLICVAKRSDGKGVEKYIFGFGSAQSRESAATKAILECVQNFPLLFSSRPVQAVSLTEFRSLSSWQPIHHGLLGLDPDYVRQIRHLFPDAQMDGPDFREKRPFRLDDFDVRKLKIPDILEDLRDRMSVVQVSHRDLIEYDCGFKPNSLPHFIG